MKNTHKVLFVAAMVCVQPASAFMGIGDVVSDPILTGKTIAAEAARLGQTTQMIQNQVNMYTNMVRNTLALGDPVFKPIGDTMRSLYGVYNQGQSLMYRAQNIDQQFNLMNPGYQSYIWTMGNGGNMTFTEKYKEWSDKGSENLRTSLKANGLQYEKQETTDALLQQLIARSSTAKGQMGALQAGNEFAALQAQQMQDLQMIVSEQGRMHASYLALQLDRQAADDASVQNWRAKPFQNTKGVGF